MISEVGAEPMTVERFALTHKVTLRIHELADNVNENDRDVTIVDLDATVSAVIADRIAHEVHKALADDHGPPRVFSFQEGEK